MLTASRLINKRKNIYTRFERKRKIERRETNVKKKKNIEKKENKINRARSHMAVHHRAKLGTLFLYGK